MCESVGRSTADSGKFGLTLPVATEQNWVSTNVIASKSIKIEMFQLSHTNGSEFNYLYTSILYTSKTDMLI